MQSSVAARRAYSWYQLSGSSERSTVSPAKMVLQSPLPSSTLTVSSSDSLDKSLWGIDAGARRKAGATVGTTDDSKLSSQALIALLPLRSTRLRSASNAC